MKFHSNAAMMVAAIISYSVLPRLCILVIKQDNVIYVNTG